MSRLAPAGRVMARLRQGVDRIPANGGFEKGFSGSLRKTRRQESSRAVYDGMSKMCHMSPPPVLNGRQAKFAIFRQDLCIAMKNV